MIVQQSFLMCINTLSGLKPDKSYQGLSERHSSELWWVEHVTWGQKSNHLMVFLVNMSWTSTERNLMSQGLWTCRDVRQLLEPNLSLEGLGQRYGLSQDEGKGLFPHSWNNSLWKLKHTTILPSEESLAWRNDLTGTRPSLEAIHQAHHEFHTRGFANVYDYLCYYLQVD